MEKIKSGVLVSNSQHTEDRAIGLFDPSLLFFLQSISTMKVLHRQDYNLDYYECEPSVDFSNLITVSFSQRST